MFRSSSARPAKTHRLSGLETLEAREVMSASILGGALFIQGTGGNDTVKVTQVGTAITVTDNGVARRFAASAIPNGIQFYGLGGNDRFENATSIKSTAYGGYGNDVLIGGSGNDTLYGGHDNDRLYGRGGTDSLFGDAGSDFLDTGSLSAAAAENVRLSLVTNGGAGDDFLAHKPAVNGTTAGDVIQGDIGVCWVVSSIAAAAHQGVDLASRVSYLGNDTYQVKLFQTVNFRVVEKLVNVKFDGTVLSSDAQPHGHGQEGEFLPLLLQRAFMKLHNLDPATVGGWVPNDSLTAFTGRPTDFRVKAGSWLEGADTPLGRVKGNPDHLRELVHVQKKAVVACTPPWETSPELVGQHCYAITKVERVNGKWFVTLYNPWGVDGAGATGDAAKDGFVRVSWESFDKGTLSYWFA
jgi:hypothetical protein